MPRASWPISERRPGDGRRHCDINRVTWHARRLERGFWLRARLCLRLLLLRQLAQEERCAQWPVTKNRAGSLSVRPGSERMTWRMQAAENGGALQSRSSVTHLSSEGPRPAESAADPAGRPAGLGVFRPRNP